MNKQKYLQIQLMIIQIGQIAHQLDLEGFLAQISTAEAAGPVIDPTLYRRAIANLESIKGLAKSIIPVKEAYEKTFRSIIETASAEAAQKMVETDVSAPEAKL